MRRGRERRRNLSAVRGARERARNHDRNPSAVEEAQRRREAQRRGLGARPHHRPWEFASCTHNPPNHKKTKRTARNPLCPSTWIPLDGHCHADDTRALAVLGLFSIHVTNCHALADPSGRAVGGARDGFPSLSGKIARRPVFGLGYCHESRHSTAIRLSATSLVRTCARLLTAVLGELPRLVARYLQYDGAWLQEHTPSSTPRVNGLREQHIVPCIKPPPLLRQL